MQIILGTMTFGEQLFGDDVCSIINEYLDCGYNRLDTAYVYNEGKSEKLIGYALKSIPRNRLIIDSKVNPRITGALDADAVSFQLEGSLKRLKTDYIDTYYFHFPIKDAPLENALERVNEYHKKGMIKAFGLSNYPEDLVIKIYEICRKNGWLIPTAYEGLYNPLSRNAESLDGTLTKLNMTFNCYNPLAGGLLTGKYEKYEDKPAKGRFTFRPNYQNRYWKKSFFDAAEIIKAEAQKYGLTITEAVFRWLACSSMLKSERGDAIIIGVSNIRHLRNNIEFINSGELPDELMESFDKAWKTCGEESPQYYRFYGDKE